MSLAGLIDVIHWLEDVFERLQLKRAAPLPTTTMLRPA
jgi:hypothetical protein